jgi:hypothetical protein
MYRFEEKTEMGVDKGKGRKEGVGRIPTLVLKQR